MHGWGWGVPENRNVVRWRSGLGPSGYVCNFWVQVEIITNCTNIDYGYVCNFWVQVEIITN